MSSNSMTDTRRNAILCLVVLTLIAAAFLLPFKRPASAAQGMVPQTASHENELNNYDIRTDKSAFEKIAAFRNTAGKSAVEIADARDGFVVGEQNLRQNVPSLKVEYNSDIRIPEVIGPDVKQGRAYLTRPSSAKRSDILREFLRQNAGLVGSTSEQIDELKVFADYTNPDGNLSFVELNQDINGIPVFRGEVKAGFTKQGEIIRVINNLAPAIDHTAVSAEFGDPLAAVRAAAGYINSDISTLNIKREQTVSSELKTIFGTGDSATTAEKMYFPTEPGVALPAWRVLIWQPVNAYYIIVDAAHGTMLWRKNITEDQTQSATYGVYANPNAMINVADNPFPFTPGPTSPNGQQGSPISRTNITRIGNETPYTFNNNGWITDGGDRTDGNAVQAGLDRDGVDGVDPNSEAINAGRTFAYRYSPLNPNSNTGEAPVAVPQTYPGSAFQQGSVTQLFYITNWYHDELYRLGFTEQARNFQDSNFGRGGVESDRIRGEGQDSSGTNNANFSTPADGGRGRMQMYIWTAPTPDIDGNLDADVVIHEITHGTSNRLHGNGSGLSTNMSRGMGEGWSDWYAHCLLSEPSDPINGIYTTGSYDTYLSGAGLNNYYYAIRRFPKAVMAFTGGPNNRPHNPLTFADVDATQQNLNDGAYPPRFNTTADQVHAAGEVWSTALWEVRGRLVTRLGWADGNRRVLQYVTDGMKLAPIGPTFLQERDAIIAAAQSSLPSGQANPDTADVWAGFAIRGMGFSAVVNNPGSGSGTARVTEAFDLPNLLQTPSFTVSDATGNNNGFPEPGETVSLSIPLSNNSGINATNTTLQVAGGNSVNYGTINNNSTVTQSVLYTVPANTPCGSSISVTFNVVSSLGPTSFTRTLIAGVPVATFTESFDSVTAPNLPTGWLTAQSGSGVLFGTVTNNTNSAPNSVFTPNTALIGGASLTSPAIPITSEAAIVTFRNRYDTEDGWDGGAFEISINGGAFTDILTAGGRFIEGGYNAAVGTVANNPISGRPAWTGTSSGFITTKIQLPASAAGQSVSLRWLFGEDTNTASVGWWVDNVEVAGNYTCSTLNLRSRADFDGDSKTDISVFRPSDGNWYLNRSTQGFTALNFGLSADIPTPGDFDGDGKADVAVWRPSDGNWHRLNSSNGQYVVNHFGSNGDIPQSGDFDADGKDDIAVFRPSNGLWYVLNSSNGIITILNFGLNGDKPVADDYDGDGKDDIAVWRPSTGIWYRMNSGNGQFFAVPFGLPEDLPTPADYDGDGKTDVAVYRPSSGIWYRLNSSNGQFGAIAFGLSGDIPAPGDYDGDGKDDQAVYRAGIWYLNRSLSGFSASSFGLPDDLPIPNKYIP
ncbi:MAG: M36 family metallopeptidase [Pyrinomonadaceae bacterium]